MSLHLVAREARNYSLDSGLPRVKRAGSKEVRLALVIPARACLLERDKDSISPYLLPYRLNLWERVADYLPKAE